jgi:transcriptional regulator with XRE-family HTH domain
MKAENYTSDLIDAITDSVSPSLQKTIDRKMMLAAKIYDAMKAKGWNQSMFAEEMGKRPSEISKWLSGTHSFNSDTLWTIGDKLGIDLLPVTTAPKIIGVKYVSVLIKALPTPATVKKANEYFESQAKWKQMFSYGSNKPGGIIIA